MWSFLFSDICLHFVCLVRHLDVVAASPVFSSDVDNVHVTFPEPIKLMDLYSNFKLTVEVYTLQTLAEVLPHEIKYHIQSESGHLAKRVRIFDWSFVCFFTSYWRLLMIEMRFFCCRSAKLPRSFWNTTVACRCQSFNLPQDQMPWDRLLSLSQVPLASLSMTFIAGSLLWRM